MTAGMKALFSAAAAATSFRDGALEIEDSTLDVNGGSTVNLRVRLTERPRSDVTVALSESSSLISLSPDSLTFTRDNWDVYQSVTVTAGGNRQDASLPATSFERTPNNFVVWNNLSIMVDSTLTPSGEDRSVFNLRIWLNGFVEFDIIGGDLSDLFEQSGSVRVEAGGESVLFEMAGLDTADPYRFTPANSMEVGAFADALDSLNPRSVPATLTLRDYTPGDAVISLSASGPREYEGKTGTATVTVS